jgi:predicted amidohydrolase
MKIAAVQMDVTIGENEANVEKMIGLLQEATAAGSELTVFPECAVSGYCFDDLDAARPYAQPVPGPASERMTNVCAKLSSFAVFGLLEADGPRIFNTAVLTGPEGVISTYRKVHLPYLGIDRFTTPGDRPFAVHAAGDLRVGMSICYDSAFPEASRAMTLLGADVIVLPTNWPPPAEFVAAHAINTRAMENAVYYLAANRVGTEGGVEFIGRSKICDPNGRTLVESIGMDEEILFADIDPANARQKRRVRVAGEHEIDRLADRRPEMYGLLTEPHDLKPPCRA